MKLSFTEWKALQVDMDSKNKKVLRHYRSEDWYWKAYSKYKTK